MRLISLEVAAFIVLRSTKPANIADAANKAEHAALCNFISMAGRVIAVPTVQPLDTENYAYIQQLNFALGDQQWQEKFYKNSDRKGVKDTAAEAGITGEGAADMWADLKKAAEALKSDSQNPLLKELEEMKLTAAARRLAKAELESLTNESREIKKMYPDPPKNVDYENNNPKSKLLAALLGAGNADVGTATGQKAVGAAATATRQATCTAGEKTTARPASALAMLACVCQSSGTAVTNFICTEKAKDSNAWTGNAYPHDTGLRHIGKSCPKARDDPVTTTELETALNNLLALIHTDGTHEYLGAYVQTGCDGTSPNGICVQFPDLATSAPEVATRDTWLATVAEIIQNLKILENNQAKAEYVNNQIKDKKHRALAALRRSKAIAGAIQVPTPQTAQKPKIGVNTRCEAHNKSKAACLGAKCKWGGQKDDDGPCSPSEEQAAEEEKETAGEAVTGTATEKCKGKLEPECTKAPEFKWENSACKDSIFLVNKKFALSMDAAFLSLVVFRYFIILAF
ncbi:variant surface glycoprotein (VSG, atypical), putative [Trypanosoma brucei brucei TREU927]|uniref:Variant surface glycoprotein (VSG, atypical), putative n=1 Tax=Trypanosoma brucei brucei (strain 927/4 GUTat10.1) TaxID=185431 RepID=Q38CQ9_TRYB2|nr:variant surface glycoprotein [Trypanosoma brucei brucei TREU927]EAN77411.1 variant surface glycoprotein (VSG, atypical), putative [Trypanosoma brucei brucei TREU927]